MTTTMDELDPSYPPAPTLPQTFSMPLSDTNYDDCWASSGTLAFAVEDDLLAANPINRTDPNGLWGVDVHKDLTTELARRAGLTSPDFIGQMANTPDEDESDPPTAFYYLVRATLNPKDKDLTAEAIKRVHLAGEWHFPVSADGWVHPGSVEAWAKVNAAIETRDIAAFARGLHVLQDSYSHQGRPFVAGIGHYRCALKKVKDRRIGFAVHSYGLEWQVFDVVTTVNRDGEAYAASPLGDADDVKVWPASARAAGLATYQAMLKFIEKNERFVLKRSDGPYYWSKRDFWSNTAPLARLGIGQQSQEQVEAYLLERYRGNDDH